MKFENTLTSNWENSFRGLRNPKNSWERSDSQFGLADNDFYVADVEGDIIYAWIKSEEKQNNKKYNFEEYEDRQQFFISFFIKNSVIRRGDGEAFEYAYIGPNDMDLAQRMIASGRPNDKFLRQIFVSVDITAPLYLWKEIDTYKVGTVGNSASTMHKLASTPITLDCFEIDDLNADFSIFNSNTECQMFGHANFIQSTIEYLERLRLKYLETKDIRYWKELIRWLPESWLQKRTWTANYDVLRNIYHWRKDHRLQEWHSFCDWIKALPYAEELILYKN